MTGPNDYYVITSRRGNYPERWSWEVRRKSKPLGVKMTEDGFQSEMAAQFAGKRALAKFSDRIVERGETQVMPPIRMKVRHMALVAPELIRINSFCQF